ncbi:MAG: hypothetical protein IJ348_06715 [Alistipes sp.]|nr:hypothetical protein [Alistipes sp.]
MAEAKRYRIEIEVAHPQHWRYNVVVTCGLFDREGNQMGFTGVDDSIAPIGSALTSAPEGTPDFRFIIFEAEDCHHIHLFAYVIPNTLPAESDVIHVRPFPFIIKVMYDGKLLLRKKLRTSQWAGLSRDFVVERPEQ